MGFVLYGEFFWARRHQTSSLDAALGRSLLDKRHPGHGQWGLCSANSIHLTNVIRNNQAEPEIDVVVNVPEPPAAMHEIDWTAPSPGAVLLTQHTAHGWLYCRHHRGQFDPSDLHFEWTRLILPGQSVEIAMVSYAGQPLELMLPPPAREAREQAEAPPPRPGRDADAIELLNYYPCWPVSRWEAHEGAWTCSALPEPEVTITLQPLTQLFEAKLEEMNSLLLTHGIVSQNIDSGGHSVGSCWYSVRVTDEHRRIIGCGPHDDVPTAWYCTTHLLEGDFEDAVSQEFDPERLIEERHCRAECSGGTEPPPGCSHTHIYVLETREIRKADLARSVATAALAVGLVVRWNGDSDMAVVVAMPDVMSPTALARA